MYDQVQYPHQSVSLPQNSKSSSFLQPPFQIKRNGHQGDLNR